MPEDKEKGLAFAILRKKEDNESEDKEEKQEDSVELEMAAKNLMQAQKSGNAKEYAESLKEFIHMCGY